MSSLVKAAQAAGPQGKTAPAGGGKIPAPQGDGLKTAWKNQTVSPSAKVPMGAAKRKVR